MNKGITYNRQDHYYPFGMRINGQHYNGLLSGVEANKYLYNAKELQTQTGYYDYGFRQYDPALGRWHVADAMAEKYMSTSPYAYVLNNPINSVDLLGLDPYPYPLDNPEGDASLDIHFYNSEAFAGWMRFNFHKDLGPTGEDYDTWVEMGGLENGGNFRDWYAAGGRAGMTLNDYAGVAGAEIRGYFWDEGTNSIYIEYTSGNERIINLGKIGITLSRNEDGTTNWSGIAVLSGENDFENSENSSSWFTDNKLDADITAGILTFLASAEHAAEITDGAGSGALFKAMGRYVFVASAVYNSAVVFEAIENGNYNLAIKTTIDTGFSAIMTFGNIPGLVIGVVYFGVDATIGWPEMGRRMQHNIQNNEYWWRTFAH